MTKIQTYITAFVMMLTITSCSDFLKEEDKDKLIPETIEQYESMMHEEAFQKITFFYSSDLMTDDITENSNAATKVKNAYKSLYTWAQDVERDGDGEKTTATNQWFKQLYHDILVANYVLEQLEQATGTDSEKEQLCGEAYFVRARAFFELANIYAPAYHQETAATTIGVPIRLDTGVQNTYSRNSLQEVYEQILSDLEAAKTAFGNTTEKMSLWHPNLKATKLLLSRVYLYMEDYDNVISITTDLIENSAGLWNLSEHPDEVFVTKSNPEIFHSYGKCQNLIVEGSESDGWHNDVPTMYSGYDDNSRSNVSYGVSNDLLNSFHEGDLRKSLFLVSSSGMDLPAKWNSQYTSLGAYSYRLSEAYLNRAEAYAAKGNKEKALADVRKLIENRVSDISKVDFSAADKDIRSFVMDERRLELLGENHRWYDLKRSTEWYPKTITHTFTLRASGQYGSTGIEQGKETYTLNPSDPNFVFEIPEDETTINYDITPYGKRVNK